MSAIDPNEINSFDDISTDKAKSDKTLEKSIYNIYKIRWNIRSYLLPTVKYLIY